MVLVGYEDCLVAKLISEYISELSCLNFLTEMFSYRYHLMVIIKKWMKLSPNPFLFSRLLTSITIAIKIILIFEPTISTTKFICVFQCSFKTHYLLIFGALL